MCKHNLDNEQKNTWKFCPYCGEPIHKDILQMSLCEMHNEIKNNGYCFLSFLIKDFGFKTLILFSNRRTHQVMTSDETLIEFYRRCTRFIREKGD